MANIIFFDLDGTLRETKSGATFINYPADQQPIAGIKKALTYYQEKGFLLIGITNQGGVAAGHKSLQSAIEEQRITLQLFPELSEIFFCTNWGESCWQLSDGNVPLDFSAPRAGNGTAISCRKPGHGMLLVASESFGLEGAWMIGDRPEDQKCAEAAGVKFIWASVMHAKFAGPGMREIERQHIDPNVLTEFLSI